MNDPAKTKAGEVLASVRSLHKTFTVREGWRTRKVVALRDINVDVKRGATLGIIGDSGSGKTTLARCMAAMERAESGSVLVDGIDITRASASELHRLRSKVQLIFQDASTALNPRFTAEELIVEPLLIRRSGTRASRRDRALSLMREVGLSTDWSGRRAGQFSGGQLQRIALARALACEPTLLIVDEVFSGLDVSTAAQIANLLLEVREKHGLTYILISHDLALASRFCDEIAVMTAGELVEHGPVAELCAAPRHSATCALLETASAMSNEFLRAAGAGA